MNDWREKAAWTKKRGSGVPTREQLHVIGPTYAARKWVGTDGKTYETRADWESSCLRYKGVMRS